MIKKISVWAALWMTGLAYAATAGAVEILINPGFETGTLAPWTSNGALVTSADAHTGTYSVNADGAEFVRQDFGPVPTSAISEVSFWVKRLGGPFDDVEFFYSDSTTNSALISSSGNGWMFFDVTADLLAGKDLVALRVFGTTDLQNPSATAFLDDFSIQAQVAQAPEPATLILFSIGLAGLGFSRRKQAS